MKYPKTIFASMASETSWKDVWLQLSASGDGKEYIQEIQEIISQLYPNFSRLEFTAQGRDAISKALKALDISKNSIVLTNAFSCCAIEQAVRATNAKMSYVDISKNLEVTTGLLEEYVSKHKKPDLFIVQSTLGYATQVETLIAWCHENNILVLVDLAQSFGAETEQEIGETHNSQQNQTTSPKMLVGQNADALVFSFGRDKVLSAFQGGAYSIHQKHNHQSEVIIVSNPSFQERFYPLFMLLVRNTYSLLLGKVFHLIEKKFHLFKSPMEKVQNNKISVSSLRVVASRLKKWQETRNHSRLIALTYDYFLSSISPVTQLHIKSGSALRYPILVDDPIKTIESLQSVGLHVSDRWYRKPIDCGSVKFDSIYEEDSCPQAENYSKTIINLPTHSEVSILDAVKIAHFIQTTELPKKEYQLVECDDKSLWQAAMNLYPNSNFLQSFEWGNFQANMGKKILRLLILEDQKPTGCVLAWLESAKRGKYVVIAGGPLLNWQDLNLVDSVLKTVGSWAKKHGAQFLRVRPQLENSPINSAIINYFFDLQSPMHVTADLTIQLDLSLTEEELLAQMRKNTRSAIKKAEKVGIKTIVSEDISEVSTFYDEQLEVAKKQKFVPFSKKFLRTQFLAFSKEHNVAFIHGKHENSLLASAFVILYGNEAVYHYGVSTDANRTMPGAYAVQWRAILEAKKRGMKRYNFWGVAPKNDSNHRFAGVSTFKRGFGGKEVQYVPAHDKVLSQKYYLIWILESIRRKLRKL